MDGGSLAVLVPTALSLWVYLLVQAAFALGMRRGRRPPAPAAPQPRVSILKPLAGADDELRANLASFAGLDYPWYELLLGVASTADPAYPVARAFIETSPAVKARVVVTGAIEASNPKAAGSWVTEESRLSGDLTLRPASGCGSMGCRQGSRADAAPLDRCNLHDSFFCTKTIGKEKLQTGIKKK